MKTPILALTLLFAASTASFAQQGDRPNRPNRDNDDRPRYEQREPGDGFERMAQRLDLSADQKTKIEALQVPHMKKMVDYRNQLAEKRAQKQTQMSADKPDQKKINALIDEMAKLQADSQKEQAAHRLQVRELLTDKQKVKFDLMAERMGKGRGNGGCKNAPKR